MSQIVVTQSRGSILAVCPIPHAMKVVIFGVELVDVGGKIMTNQVNDC